ncbi:hemerythrin domain-containing protein [Aquabacterium sp.]|uniref:hemerythrin domain-containing protein n=1 Tax=Aquabacterium sp. TaxID=1872578 RepID=UPI002C19FCC5|nr:hemerythrin domain-containing protein [Aquabacterium sp.]HSW08800.1 hemerythrin domain-containing protein [Aquabacterium sp.]
MLAAECAWAILRADHAKLRYLIGSIADEASGGQWRDAGPGLAQLRQLIESLQSFDHASHRPKGSALLSALRGRSPDADRLLAEMEQEREGDDALLNQAMARLEAVEKGDARASAECAVLLAQHRERVLHHLDLEDTLLCAQTERLLTHEEWAHVVSAISTAIYPAAAAVAGAQGYGSESHA